MALGTLRRRIALFAFLLAATSAPLPASGPSPAEHEVKAAFLFNFVKFVEWPSQSFSGPEAPFRICLLGGDLFGDELDRALADKTVRDRKLLVRRIRRPEEAAGCQVLFIGHSEGGRLEGLLTAVKEAPVLTVGDVEGFAERGGMIGFALEGNKVRFHINPGPASASGLKISSQLLKLAKIVG